MTQGEPLKRTEVNLPAGDGLDLGTYRTPLEKCKGLQLNIEYHRAR